MEKNQYEEIMNAIDMLSGQIDTVMAHVVNLRRQLFDE